MKQQQTNKPRRTGALIALPFVLSWKLVTLVWTGLMGVRAWNKAHFQSSQAEIDEHERQVEAFDREHQRQMEAFDRDEEETFYDEMLRW